MDLELQLKALQEAVEKKSNELVTKAVADLSASIKEAKENSASKESVALIEKQMADTIKGFEDFQVKYKPQGKTKLKSFGEIFAETVRENAKAINMVSKASPFQTMLELKAVGDMSTANFGGDSNTVLSYNQRQAILPSTKLNFRDLFPTQNSGTLVSVHYKETAGEGGIATQSTQGAAKSQIDFDFTKVETVSKFIAGYARFGKQLLKAIPWMETTLPRLLLREFYNQENSDFYTKLAAAATVITPVETDDVKAIIDLIATQRSAKYAASFGLVSHTQLARLNKLTYTNGYYSGSGGVLTNVDGSMQISGVPIIPADWVADDKIIVCDRDYVERVEGESLKIEFFEQDSDNVQRNLITARVECLEELNVMQPLAVRIADLGNVA